MNSKRSVPIIILAATVFLCILVAVIAAGGFLIAGPIARTQPRTDDEAIRMAFSEEYNRRTGDLPRDALDRNYVYEISSMEIEGEWAVADVRVLDENRMLMGEPAVGLFRKVNGEWMYAAQGTEIFKDWLFGVPDSLMPYDLKILLQ
jgi:hypothetical protein